jgi:2-hydroxychromene-2-carboxylate isomerase
VADYATLLRDHVTLTCRSVDRMFLQAYVPKLQCVGGVCQFLYLQKGFSIPSSAAFGKIGDAYVAEIHRWAKKNGIPVRRFAKGENKQEIARPLIEAAEREAATGKWC